MLCGDKQQTTHGTISHFWKNTYFRRYSGHKNYVANIFYEFVHSYAKFVSFKDRYKHEHVNSRQTSYLKRLCYLFFVVR